MQWLSFNCSTYESYKNIVRNICSLCVKHHRLRMRTNYAAKLGYGNLKVQLVHRFSYTHVRTQPFIAAIFCTIFILIRSIALRIIIHLNICFDCYLLYCFSQCDATLILLSYALRKDTLLTDVTSNQWFGKSLMKRS